MFAGTVTGISDLVSSFLMHPNSVASMVGGFDCNAPFQMDVCKWARFTFSEKASVVGGSVARLGALAAPGLPVLPVHTLILASVIEMAVGCP